MAKRFRKTPTRRLEPARSLSELVPHPRYGSVSVPSGCTASAEEVRRSFYRYSDEIIYPESAIPADLARQNFSVFPRGYYVDTLKTCQACGRPFIFFAREQQHWYETLGFYVDADCRCCFVCRRSDQQLRLRFGRYSENVGRADLSEAALSTLVEDAVFLWEAGVLRAEQRVRRLANLAQRRIPRSVAAKHIAALITRLEAESGTER